jgi:glycosyltransferase involved in cell wall biosynthesis
MSQPTPLVSCLMPTHNRRAFLPRAVELFLAQDYPRRELLVIDDGSDAVGDLLPADPRIRYHRLPERLTLGEKRNLAAERAAGEVLAHWDDDDWMAPWRLRYQVRELLESGVDACGLERLFFHDPASDRAWEYRYSGLLPWVAGGTLCYTRSFWEGHRFAAIGEGEDNDFLWRHRPRLLRLADPGFYVATVHRGNTSRKLTAGANWHPAKPRELPHQRPSPPPAGDGPRISCVMPTGGRKAFALQAVHYFLRQTWPNKELVIVDTGTDGLEEQLPADRRLRYLRSPGGISLGAKRNLGVAESSGELIAGWDDDDWYSPRRLELQAEALLREEAADLCAPRPELLYEMAADRFWELAAERWEPMFFQGVLLGPAMVYRRRVWEAGLRYSDVNFGEDMLFVKDLLARGGKLVKIPNGGIVIYMRHPGNTWRFTCGVEGGAQGWSRVPRPGFLSADDHAFYRRLSSAAGATPAARQAPVSNAPYLPIRRSTAPQRFPGVARGHVIVRKIRF